MRLALAILVILAIPAVSLNVLIDIRQHANRTPLVDSYKLDAWSSTRELLLTIQAISQSTKSVCLDIVGKCVELANCKSLVEKLALQECVRFLDRHSFQDDP